MTDVIYKRKQKLHTTEPTVATTSQPETKKLFVKKHQPLVHLKNEMKGLLVHEYEHHYMVEFTKEHGQTYPSIRMSCYVPKNYVLKVV